MKTEILIYCFIFVFIFLNCKKTGLESEEQPGIAKLKSGEIGRNYYVSRTGKNTNAGTILEPFQTIQKGVDVAASGSTIFVQTGVYNEQVTVYGKSGTASAPTIISAYPGQHPVIDGSGLSFKADALVMIYGSYINFTGFEIRNSNKNCITTSNGGHNLISQNIIHDILGQGIGLGGDYDVAEYNEVYNAAMSNFAKPGSVINAAGISARRSPKYAVIRHNKVHDVWGEGISTFEATYTVIEDNITYDNWSADIYVSDATNVLLQRNFICQTKNMDKASQVISASQVGILLGDENMTPMSANNTIINNIIYGCKRNLYNWGSLGTNGMKNILIANNTMVNSTFFANIQLNARSFSNVIIKNNIFAQNGKIWPISLQSNTGIAFSNNLWSTPPVSLASGPNDIIGDAKFASTYPYAVASYALLSSSPCINAGIQVGLTSDFLKKALVGLPDIGANEYAAPQTTFYNLQKSAIATRNDCGTGYTGSTVTYIVAANTYTSGISQLDADNKALADLNNNKQTYANKNGSCTIIPKVYYSIKMSATKTKNDCGTGYRGSAVTGTIPAGYSNSYVSQADADNKALIILSNSIQAYANEKGVCELIP